ncbi:MAG: hypothetical protein R3E50_09625 [Halioglobus sp.]
MYIFITSLAWSLAFVIFRATDLRSAFAVVVPGFTALAADIPPLLQQAVSNTFLGHCFAALGYPDYGYLPVYCVLGVSAFVCWCMPNTQTYMERFDPVLVGESTRSPGMGSLQWQPGWFSACIVAVLLSASLLSLSAVSEFIYFQF